MQAISSIEEEEHVLNSKIKTLDYKIIEPRTPQEFEAYFFLRWQCLREPWQKPRGSEKDELENDSIHAMLVDRQDVPIGVARLHSLSKDIGQIRYMGIADSHRNKQLGKHLLSYLEEKARNLGMCKVRLQAREEALNFYKRNGYEILERSYLMWDQIQHYLMEKVLQ